MLTADKKEYSDTEVYMIGARGSNMQLLHQCCNMQSYVLQVHGSLYASICKITKSDATMHRPTHKADNQAA